MNYESELMFLKESHLKRRSLIIEKYKDDHPHYGLDGNPHAEELGEETKRFQREWNKLKAKYNKS